MLVVCNHLLLKWPTNQPIVAVNWQDGIYLYEFSLKIRAKNSDMGILGPFLNCTTSMELEVEILLPNSVHSQTMSEGTTIKIPGAAHSSWRRALLSHSEVQLPMFSSCLIFQSAFLTLFTKKVSKQQLSLVGKCLLTSSCALCISFPDCM